MELVERNIREAYVKAMHLQHAGESESAEKGFQVRTNKEMFNLSSLLAPAFAYALAYELPSWTPSFWSLYFRPICLCDCKSRREPS
jgi:hypothetical protein